MAMMQRANVILEIDDELIEEYLHKGYNVVNNNGEVIEECIPNDLNQLRICYVEHKEIISKLEKEVESLKKQLEKKKSSKKED